MKKIFYFAIVACVLTMTACVAKFDKKVTETVTDSIPWYEDMEAFMNIELTSVVTIKITFEETS